MSEDSLFSRAWVGIEGIKKVEHCRYGMLRDQEVVYDRHGAEDIEEYEYEALLEVTVVQPNIKCAGRGLHS